MCIITYLKMKNKPAKCPECKSAISHGHIARHKAACHKGTSHTRSTKCPNCQRVFSQHQNLRKHIMNNVCNIRKLEHSLLKKGQHIRKSPAELHPNAYLGLYGARMMLKMARKKEEGMDKKESSTSDPRQVASKVEMA